MTSHHGERPPPVENQKSFVQFQGLVKQYADEDDAREHRVLAVVREEAAPLLSPRRANEHLAQDDKVHVLGRLAIGVAHDLNNVLSSLSLRLGLLKRDPTCAAQIRNVEMMGKIIDSCAARVRVLQTFSHTPDQDVESVDLAEVVTSAVAIAKTGLRDRRSRAIVRINVDLSSLPMVRGSSDELRHVFINLLINARDAMEEGGTVSISGRLDGDSVEVSVADQGTGIPSALIDQIFDPFFTTKGSNGTGIGLAVARETLERFGGTIHARNLSSGGASFDLRFAVSSGKKSSSCAVEAAAVTSELRG